MSHPLELRYGLTAHEMLDALERRFRARVTLEGAVAEVHLERKIAALERQGQIARYERHDQDGRPDFSVWVAGADAPLVIECKNVRDTDEAYRSGGNVVAYKVETQKTRAAKGDPNSRYYSVGAFDVLAVCLGKKTKDWAQFHFAAAADLARRASAPSVLAVMHPVPLPGAPDMGPWSDDLGVILGRLVGGDK